MNASRLLFEGLEDRLLLDATPVVFAGVTVLTDGPYNDSVAGVTPGVDVGFDLPKFDDMGGTRTLVGVILRSTTTVQTGARNVINASPFAGTLNELTFALNAQSDVTVTGATPTFTFGPTVLSNSLINLPMDPAQLRSVSIAGLTTGLQELTLGQSSPQLPNFISAPGDTVIHFSAASTTSVTLVTTGFVANSFTDPAVTYSMFGEVVYLYVEGSFTATDETYYGAALPEYRRPTQMFQPFYSGTAQPGSTLAIDILGPGGEVLGSTSAIVDAGGNWTASFYDTSMTGQPHTVSIRQAYAGYTPLQGRGFNLRRYFSPAFLGGAYASERLTVENVLGHRSTTVAVSALYEASAYPFAPDVALYHYEMLVYPPAPQGLN